MEDRERDLLEILRAGKSKKRLQKLFMNVGGGRTDKEAVELAIGRDPEWQHALLRVTQQIELVLTSKTVVEVLGLDYVDCIKFLIQGGLLPWMTRMLSMVLPQKSSSTKRTDLAEKWRLSFVHLVKSVYHLVKDSYIDCDLPHYALASGMVNHLTKFIDGTQQPLATVWAVSALSQLCSMYQDACEKVISSKCLPHLGHIIHRDAAQKVVVELRKEGGYKEQSEFFRSWLTYKYHLDPEAAAEMVRENLNDEERNHLYALHLARSTQRHATIVLTEVP
jgi:hypothetical protein